MSVIFTKKISAIFFLILKNYWKLNFFSSIWVSIWISNMIRIETAILSLNEVSMDFKLEILKSGQNPLLKICFWAKFRMVHFDSPFHIFDRAGNLQGALPSPRGTWRGKIWGKCLYVYSLRLEQCFRVRKKMAVKTLLSRHSDNAC